MANDFLGKYLYIFHSPGRRDIRTCSKEIQIFLVSQWFESWFSLVVYHQPLRPPGDATSGPYRPRARNWAEIWRGHSLEPGMLDVGLAGIPGFTKSMFFVLHILSWLVLRDEEMSKRWLFSEPLPSISAYRQVIQSICFLQNGEVDGATEFFQITG